MNLDNIRKAKVGSIELANASIRMKNNALKLIADALSKNKKKILNANKKDIYLAKGLSKALLKRLELDSVKIDEMVKGIKKLIKLDNPVGNVLSAVEIDKGLELYKVSCPIGVIGVIFESRPDALVQISSLCVKSGNAVILKGGSEATNSNRVLFNLIRSAIAKAGLPEAVVELMQTREDVKAILKLNDYIDLLVPRGSNKFVKYIMDNTKIPVLGHSEGVCHVYVDKDAKLGTAVNVCFDAKCQYAAVCNAMETLLVHKSIAKRFLPVIIRKYSETNVEMRLDDESRLILEKSVNKKIINNYKNKKTLKKATGKDWKTEYNDMIVSIKVVSDLDEAIDHINQYGSGHTDAIVTENKSVANKFMDVVDSGSVMWNCSTRFSDGFRYGFGAEVGISTHKIHARGPVGLEGLTIYKYKVIGTGHVVSDYSGRKAKKFIHRKIKW